MLRHTTVSCLELALRLQVEVPAWGATTAACVYSRGPGTSGALSTSVRHCTRVHTRLDIYTSLTYCKFQANIHISTTEK